MKHSSVFCLVIVFVLVLLSSTQAFLINGKPAVVKWSPFHSPENPSETLTPKPDTPKQKIPDIDRQAALIDFLTEDIKEETLFPARIAEIIDSKNESFLHWWPIFLARLHKHQNQTRYSSLDTDDLARLQILKDTANRLLERYKRKSKVRRLDDYRD